MSDIAESDWRIVRDLKPLILERFCQRVLAEVATQASSAGSSAQARYHAVWALLKAFNYPHLRQGPRWRSRSKRVGQRGRTIRRK